MLNKSSANRKLQPVTVRCQVKESKARPLKGRDTASSKSHKCYTNISKYQCKHVRERTTLKELGPADGRLTAQPVIPSIRAKEAVMHAKV